jgi:enoyl-CoA hydratase/carnithine racemase
MSKFENYADKYKTIRMERRNGVLQMTLHTDGGPLRWGFLPHGELPEAFHDVGSDYDNRVVIITGTGNSPGEACGIDRNESSVNEANRR